MTQKTAIKWRPKLVLVLGGALSGLLGMTYLGLVALRYMVPGLGWTVSVAVVGSAILIIALALAWLLARLILRPVQALALRAAALTHGDADLSPLPHYGTQELRDMGQAVLEMGGTLHSRAADLETYSQHVTHELRSPLTAVQAAAELLSAPDVDARTRAELTDTITKASQRMETLLSSLRELAQAGIGGKADWTDLRDIILQCGKQADICVTFEGSIMAPLNPRNATAVCTHFVENAKLAGASTVRFVEQPNGFLVHDNGSGVSQKNANRLFDPFFTTRRTDGGTGMGLTIVQRILNLSGGNATLLASDRGACFCIVFQ